MLKYFVNAIAISLSLSTIASAAIVNTRTGNIDRMSAYDDAVDGRGDVVIWFRTNVTQCPSGVYLKPGKPGFKSMTALSLSAFLYGRSVRFQVYDDRIWTGSRSKVCEADAVWIEN